MFLLETFPKTKRARQKQIVSIKTCFLEADTSFSENFCNLPQDLVPSINPLEGEELCSAGQSEITQCTFIQQGGTQLYFLFICPLLFYPLFPTPIFCSNQRMAQNSAAGQEKEITQQVLQLRRGESGSRSSPILRLPKEERPDQRFLMA